MQVYLDTWSHSGSFEACRKSGIREMMSVKTTASSSVPEHPTWDVIWTCSFLTINFFQALLNLTSLQGKPAVCRTQWSEKTFSWPLSGLVKKRILKKRKKAAFFQFYFEACVRAPTPWRETLMSPDKLKSQPYRLILY